MTRRATITTDHEDSTQATRIAAALRPDNTTEMETTVEGTTVRTVVERPTTGGLHATVDDYVVNCDIAARLTTHDNHE